MGSMSNFLFYVSPSILRMAVSVFFLIPFTTYYLDPENFGVAAILNAIAALLVPLSSLADSWVLSAHFFKIDAAERKVLAFNLFLFGFLYRLAWCGAFFALQSMLPSVVRDYQPEYGGYFALVLCTLALSTVWSPASSILVMEKRGATYAAVETLTFLAYVAATVGGIKCLGMTTAALFLGPLAQAVVAMLATLWVFRRDLTLRISRFWVKEVFHLGVPLIVPSCLEVLTASADRYFVQRWVSLGGLGAYEHARGYQQVFMFGTNAFIKALVPEANRIFSEHSDCRSLSRMLTLWHGLLGIGGMAVIFYSAEMIGLLTHGKFIEAAPLVGVFYLLVIAYTFGLPYTQFLGVHKKTAFVAISSSIIYTASIAVIAVLTYFMGLAGAEWGVVLCRLFIHVARRIYACRLGCPPIAERECLLVVIVTMAAYLLQELSHPSLFIRTVILALLTAGLTAHFDLLAELRQSGWQWRALFGTAATREG